MLENMIVIGLCGPSGSGKGVLCEGFSKIGIPTINADEIYHDLTSGAGECMDALRSEFGDEIVNPEGGLDRRALAKLVFSSEGSDERRKRLNEISHKFVIDEIHRILDGLKADNKYAVIDAPLLFESGLAMECDLKVCIEVDDNIRIERICKRDGISKKEARARIKSQMDDRALDRVCDYVIDNYGTKEEMYLAAEKLIKIIEKKDRCYEG